MKILHNIILLCLITSAPLGVMGVEYKIWYQDADKTTIPSLIESMVRHKQYRMLEHFLKSTQKLMLGPVAFKALINIAHSIVVQNSCSEIKTLVKTLDECFLKMALRLWYARRYNQDLDNLEIAALFKHNGRVAWTRHHEQFLKKDNDLVDAFFENDENEKKLFLTNVIATFRETLSKL